MPGMSERDIVIAALLACGGVQSELARRMGADRSLVSKWINRTLEPSPATLLRFAKVAGLDAVETMGSLLPAAWNEPPTETAA
jgi:transcriptional regulator with XRE-family HTH domain